MPEEKDKTVPSSGSIFNSQSEDESSMGEPKPKILDFSKKSSELKSDEERKPTVLEFPPKEKISETTERSPTILVFPSEESDNKRNAKPGSEERKPTTLVFPTTPAFEVKERLPKILFSGDQLKKRLRITNGDLAQLFPNVEQGVLNQARRMVLTQDITTNFSNLCMNWGLILQRKAAELSEQYAETLKNDVVTSSRASMNNIYNGLSDLQFNTQPSRGWLKELMDPKTPKELFEEKYAVIKNEINSLQQKTSGLTLVQQAIKRSADLLKMIQADLLVHIIAGQLLEFRTLLGDVDVQGDGELMKTDLEVLSKRLKSLNETLESLEALKVQQQMLYTQVSDLVLQIHDVLLVELPAWYRSMLSSGFQSDNKVNTNANWSAISELQKKIKSEEKIVIPFNLEKERRKVGFILTKANIEHIKAEVIFVLDVSYSMQGLFTRGTVEQGLKRILPIALNFDDNENLDVFTFSSGSNMVAEAESVTATNYDGYVNREIVNNRSIPKWSGTSYAPVLQEILKAKGFRTGSSGWFSSGSSLGQNSTSGYPSIIFFVTDGENDDKPATTALLQEMQNARSNAYVLFIGIGNETFGYLNKVADEFDNTGFVKINDLHAAAGSDSIYELLLPDELKQWLRKK